MSDCSEVNPWEEIPLEDYESHMRLSSVQQLQTMNRMMRRQFSLCRADEAMVLGVAGGNGLEHVVPACIGRIYGVDINPDYLKQCEARYPQLKGVLECICVDLADDNACLPHADLLIANLLIEYIGYDCFCRVVAKVNPRCVSCVIQINVDDSFVSDSPYLHIFDGLERVHHSMQEDELTCVMAKIGYRLLDKTEQQLPNGKKLVELDFVR
ncbi:class I SAM-dependent methyltransferase [uncultured Muribaculum sp.]|uniref:class I SAM-dependent methyltransferase n=1 Tax=uncultured Muribaculum sp. TaxID=1918613 RepID=UPI0025973B32|nr:class I SAM-dependent methyltransferase [uncultured Muribaculum sp.]